MKKYSKAFVFFAVSTQIPIVYSAERGRAEIRAFKRKTQFSQQVQNTDYYSICFNIFFRIDSMNL